MKVFIFSYDRFDTHTTAAYFDRDNVEYRLLIHDKDMAKRYINHGANPDYLVVTGEERGLWRNRNYALDQLEDGETALFVVDDLKSVTMLDKQIYQVKHDTVDDSLPITTSNTTEWGKKFMANVTAPELMRFAREMENQMVDTGAKLGGFASNGNPLFRVGKWKYNSLCDGRMLVVTKTNLRFDPIVETMDDYAFTCINLKAIGRTVINQWILPDCQRYTPGGYGTKEQRMEQKIRDIRYMTKKWPDLIQVKEKRDWPTGSHAAIVYHPKSFYDRRRSVDNLFD